MLLRGQKNRFLQAIRLLAGFLISCGLTLLVSHLLFSPRWTATLAALRSGERYLVFSVLFISGGLLFAWIARSVDVAEPREESADLEAVVDWIEAYEKHQSLRSLRRKDRLSEDLQRVLSHSAE